MKHGRTAIVNFLSRFGMSIAGFVATVTLTNILGKETYGTYVVVISVLAWVSIAGNMGLAPALRKRLSESTEGDLVSSGLSLQLALYVVVALFLWIGRGPLNAYMGVEATNVIIALLGVRLLVKLAQAILEGEHLVHIASVLSPIEMIARSAVQVVFVVLGFDLFGAFFGYFVGGVVATAVGAYFVRFSPSLPTREDITRLTSYAKFSWFAQVKGRAFLSMDTIILAFFVTNSVIAVYEIAWNVTSMLAIFGSSIARTLFPEISEISSQSADYEGVSEYLRLGLAYSGLFLIPGLVGGALVGDVVLTIYGDGFDTGYYILLILTFARLLYAYQMQFMSTIDAIDRPDITFRINTVFVGSNLLLNTLLVWQYGWYGAAVATTLSAGISLLLAYRAIRSFVTVDLPYRPVAKQCLSVVPMAVVVLVGRELSGDSLPVVLVLIGIGAALYFVSLVTISREFRTTVEDNLSWKMPDFIR